MSSTAVMPPRAKSALIECAESLVAYDNPQPQVHSRHGYHPGLAQHPGGELLALFVFAEAFETPNGTTHVSRSRDLGHTWELQGPLYDKSALGFDTSDTLKPDGTLVATGYRFHCANPEEGIAIPATAGFQPGDNIVSFSHDAGHTWTFPRVIERSYPELLELSGPALKPPPATWLLPRASTTCRTDRIPPANSLLSCGVAITGRLGMTEHFLFAPGSITPWETRICGMQPGRLVTIIWHTTSAIAGIWRTNWSCHTTTATRGRSSSILGTWRNPLVCCFWAASTCEAFADIAPRIPAFKFASSTSATTNGKWWTSLQFGDVRLASKPETANRWQRCSDQFVLGSHRFCA